MVRQRLCSAMAEFAFWYSCQESGFSASQSKATSKGIRCQQKFPEYVGFVRP
jgi:hypothetical protein